MIVFPPLVSLANDMKMTSNTSVMDDRQVVKSLSAYEMMLMQLSAGVVNKVAFVFPVSSPYTLDRHASAVWRASNDILGSQNCHWKVNELHELFCASTQCAGQSCLCA